MAKDWEISSRSGKRKAENGRKHQLHRVSRVFTMPLCWYKTAVSSNFRAISKSEKGHQNFIPELPLRKCYVQCRKLNSKKNQYLCVHISKRPRFDTEASCFGPKMFRDLNSRKSCCETPRAPLNAFYEKGRYLILQAFRFKLKFQNSTWKTCKANSLLSVQG